MSLFDAARYRLRNLFRARAVDSERDEEFAFHQRLSASAHEHETGDGVAAPHVARRSFGNVTLIKEEVRWMGAIRWIDQVGQDLRFALRTYRRSPVFTLVAVLSIGLGIGANTAVFGVTDGLMFQRLPVPAPHELVRLWKDDGRGGREPYFHVAEYEALERMSGADVAAMTVADAQTADIGGTEYERLMFYSVSGGLFPMLGIRPAAGRLFTPQDDRDEMPVAVLGYAYAARHFGVAENAVGRQITLQGQAFTVVGVLPREFRSLHVTEQMTIVLPRRSGVRVPQSRPDLGNLLILVTRVVPGAGGDQTRTTLERGFAACCANSQLVSPGIGTVNPIEADGQRLTFEGVSRGIPGDKGNVRDAFGPVLFALMAGVAIILLIACTNVGTLLLERATVRARELAVRMSIGASRGRVVRQLLTESVLLAAMGATVGLALAVWGTAVLADSLPGNLRVIQPFVEIRPSFGMVGFIATVAAVCVLIFGVLPAVRATRVDPVVGLRSGSPATTQSNRLDRGLIALQMGLALVFVASAGLFGATLQNLRSGIGDTDPHRLLVAEVETEGTPIKSGAERPVYDRIFERLRVLPGVNSISGTNVVPLIYMGFEKRRLDIPGFEDLAAAKYPLDQHPMATWVITAMPGFFSTMGVRLVAGREFNDGDVAGAPLAAIISESVVARFFAGRDPIGQRMGFAGGRRAVTIVGVARDIQQTDLRAPAEHSVYLARAQRRNDEDRFIYVMRTDRTAAGLSTTIAAAIKEAAPEIRVRKVQPMSEILAFGIGREQALRAVAVIFSVFAVGLAAMGLYGVLAFHVTSRSREIGIRMALGAGRSSVVRLVMGQSLVVILAGVAIGIPFALAATSSLKSLFYGVNPMAPRPFAVAVLVLLGAGVAAALLPSRSASRVDPLTAIRTE